MNKNTNVVNIQGEKQRFTFTVRAMLMSVWAHGLKQDTKKKTLTRLSCKISLTPV